MTSVLNANAGVPVADLGGSEWRANYRERFPRADQWIADPAADLSVQIPSIAAPTLLLWGDNDPISPVSVGERLAALLPNAELQIVARADHDLALTHAAMVGEMIAEHLTPRF